MITIHTKATGKWRWKRTRLPESFQEMTRRQALAFSAMLMVRQCAFDQTFSPEDQHFFIGQLLRDQGLSLDHFYNLGDLATEDLLSVVDPFFSSDHAHPALRYILVHGKKYWLPAYGLQGFPFFNFTVAEQYYNNIAQGTTDLEANLIGLAAALCTRKTPLRRHPERVEGYKKVIQKITTSRAHVDAKGKLRQAKAIWNSTTDVELYGVLYWYRHTRELLRADYEAVFTERQAVQGPDFTSKYGWSAVSEELAGGPFGTAQELDYTNVHRILHHVAYNSDKYKEQEIKSMINGK